MLWHSCGNAARASRNRAISLVDELFDIAGELDVAKAQPVLLVLKYPAHRMSSGKRRADLRCGQHEIGPAVAARPSANA